MENYRDEGKKPRSCERSNAAGQMPKEKKAGMEGRLGVLISCPYGEAIPISGRGMISALSAEGAVFAKEKGEETPLRRP